MTENAVTEQAAGVRGGLLRYVLAATLARAADGGGVVAVVLLVTTSGGPGWEAGLLGACITFPHLLGPFIARTLDVARDGRTVLAIACVLHGATLAAGMLTYGHTWVGIPALFFVATGLTGPLLTGGISSRLPAIAGPGLVLQRRAQGWDVATYGIGGTIGPTIVAVVSGWTNPTVAGLVLAAGTFAAALVVRLLPYTTPVGSSEVPSVVRTIGIMVRSGPLRRTLYQTMVVALSVAVLPVTAVASTKLYGVEPAVAGALTAAYGLGGLAGSAGVMIRPPRGDADVAMPILASGVALALGLVPIAPGIWFAAGIFAAAGILNSYFFASTLAARSEYAPPVVRGQVFVWVGALKIASGSTGTALAGILISQAVHLPVTVGATLTLACAGIAVVDRTFTARRTQRRHQAAVT